MIRLAILVYKRTLIMFACCDGSNCRIPRHSKLYPLKSGYLATQFVHSLFFMFLEREIDSLRDYVARGLRGYGATELRGYGATPGATELHGYGATWLRGYVATGLSGYVATGAKWLLGYVATGLSKGVFIQTRLRVIGGK